MKRQIKVRVTSLSRCGNVFSSRGESLVTDLGSEVSMLCRFDKHTEKRVNKSREVAYDPTRPLLGEYGMRQDSLDST